MKEEDKNKIIQKLTDKGLCNIDANLVLNKAIEYGSLRGYSAVEHYANDLADLIIQTVLFNKQTGEVKTKPFKLSIDYNIGKTIIDY